jgi:hypothetical protein
VTALDVAVRYAVDPVFLLALLWLGSALLGALR